MKIRRITIRGIVVLPKIHSVEFTIRRISVCTENSIRRINDPSNERLVESAKMKNASTFKNYIAHSFKVREKFII